MIDLAMKTLITGNYDKFSELIKILLKNINFI